MGKVQKAGEILKTKTKRLICFHRENRHSLKNTQVKKVNYKYSSNWRSVVLQCIEHLIDTKQISSFLNYALGVKKFGTSKDLELIPNCLFAWMEIMNLDNKCALI